MIIKKPNASVETGWESDGVTTSTLLNVDITAKRLGVGVNSPVAKVDVKENVVSASNVLPIRVEGNNTGSGDVFSYFFNWGGALARTALIGVLSEAWASSATTFLAGGQSKVTADTVAGTELIGHAIELNDTIGYPNRIGLRVNNLNPALPGHDLIRAVGVWTDGLDLSSYGTVTNVLRAAANSPIILGGKTFQYGSGSSKFEFDAGLQIKDTNTYIDRDTGNNLAFTDAITGTKTLAELVPSSGQALACLFIEDQANVSFGTSQVVPWATEPSIIEGGAWASNQLTVSQDGRYEVHSIISLLNQSGQANDTIYFQIRKNSVMIAEQTVNPMAYAGDTEETQISVTGIFDFVVNDVIELYLAGVNDIQLYTSRQLSIKQLPATLVAGGGAFAEYLQASKAISQLNISNADNIIFDTEDTSSGSNISLNTTTGIFTLQAGKTYKLMAGIRFQHTVAETIGFAWYNITTTSVISERARLDNMLSTGGYSSLPVAATIITPPVTTQVSFRCTWGGDGVEDVNAGYAWAIVEVIAGNALYSDVWTQVGSDVHYDTGGANAKDGFATKLWDVIGGHLETAIDNVEYYSPNQHGGRHGTIYRQYFGTSLPASLTGGNNVSALIDYALKFTSGGTSRLLVRGTGSWDADLASISLSGISGFGNLTIATVDWLITDGWVDYTK